MFKRVVALFVVLAIAVVTTVSSAHAASMIVRPAMDHMMHSGEIMSHGADTTMTGSDMGQPSGSAAASLCDFVCHSVPLGLNTPIAEARFANYLASFNIPAAEVHVGRAPELNKRPPKLRLL